MIVHTDVHAPNMYLVLAPRKNTASRHTTVDHTTTPSLAALAMGIVSKLTDKLVGGRPLMKRSRLPERSATRLRLEKLFLKPLQLLAPLPMLHLLDHSDHENNDVTVRKRPAIGTTRSVSKGQ